MTPHLVLLSEERDKRAVEDQAALVLGLRKLLEAAENGVVKGVCYATVNSDDQLSIGILGTSDCGVHELVGASQMLNFRLLKASGV